MHEIDRRKKLNTFGDFENKTPTHKDTTTQFQNLSEIFKSEFPGNWIKLFNPRISMIY